MRALRRVVFALLGVIPLAVLSGAVAGPSTFPGTNGQLVFDGVDSATQTVQVFRLSATGGTPTRLTQGTAGVWNECPSWSSKAKFIYFDSVNRTRLGPSRIYRVRPNGTGRALADRRSATAHVCPSVDRSGRRVVAMNFAKGGQSEIVRMGSNGSNPVQLTRVARLQNNYDPSYAPTGQRIVFNRVTYRLHGGFARGEVVVVSATGRKTVITRRSRFMFFSPSWSPDGKTILAVRGAAQGTIVRMRPNGTGVRVLASVRGVQISSPVFSPDGSKIAFVQCRGDCGDPLNPGAGDGSIWVMNANGSGRRAILTEASGVQPVLRVDWGIAAPGR